MAFAGSGEVAVTSCVVQILAASKGTLLLLDEPEVSLHPGAQERLLAFLAQISKRKQLQVVFSTHSPHMIGALPDDAIKTLYQLPEGRFGVIQSTHPYAAFRRLGDVRSGEVQVIVEDLLAQAVVRQAISLIDDEAVQNLFKVEYVQGGASSILATRIPVLMERGGHLLVLLDGDQRKVKEIRNPDEIPVSEDNTLEKVIHDDVGVKPTLLIDGGTSGGDEKQKVAFRRRYLQWVRHNLRYIPTSCPEELVLRAAEKIEDHETQPPQHYKKLLRDAAIETLARTLTSEEVDHFGEVLLGSHKGSTHLVKLRQILLDFLTSIKSPAATPNHAN